MCEEISDVPQWYVLRAQTKREHIAAANLRKITGVEVFCPRLRYRKATRRGKIWWIEPLFPGYLMAYFSLFSQRRHVLSIPGVSGVVHFGDSVPTLSGNLISSLRREIEVSGDSALREVLTFEVGVEPGEEVEVAEGPLKGAKGVVTKLLPGNERVRVLMEFLGQASEVEMDLYSLILEKRPLPQEGEIALASSG